jgi:hypothetical protein
MAEAGQEVPKCAYPGCENEARPREAGAAEPGYCGLPDPVTGEPHTALTAFRRRQVLARQGGGATGPGDPDPCYASVVMSTGRHSRWTGEARVT